MAVRDIPRPSKEEVRLRQLYRNLENNLIPDEKTITRSDYGEYIEVAYQSCKCASQGTDKFKEYKKKLLIERPDIISIISGLPLKQGKAEESSSVGTLLSEVQPEQTVWLWKHRLALRKMTTLDGDPGLGKSNLMLDLAARVSTGKAMPDGEPCVQGGVVLIMPEDGLSDTIQPRLARAGADLTKIVAIGTLPTTDSNGFTYLRPFTLPEDLHILKSAIDRVQAKLVIIDPVMAILGTKDTYKDNEVRAILSPVQMLIQESGASCVMIRHLTKGGGDNALYRGGGSMAFIALSRTGLMVVKDPVDETRNVFAHIKSNIGKIAPSLTYTIQSEEGIDERPHVVWGEVTNINASELLTQPRKNTGSNRQEILHVLKRHFPDEMTIAEINEILPEMTLTNLKTTLKRMYDNGEIGKSERGSYHALL